MIYSQFSRRNIYFKIRRLPFVICHSSFVIHHLPFVIRHSSFAIRHSPFVIRHSQVILPIHSLLQRLYDRPHVLRALARTDEQHIPGVHDHQIRHADGGNPRWSPTATAPGCSVWPSPATTAYRSTPRSSTLPVCSTTSAWSTRCPTCASP